jgi:hypothetical protein
VNNPLIRRYRYSQLRPRQLWVNATIYIGVILLILSLNYIVCKQQTMMRMPGYSFIGTEDFFRRVCHQLLTMQVILLCMMAVLNSASAIREEITGKSYDFFRMLPISAGRKLAGILIGKNIFVLLCVGVNFLLIVIFSIPGRVSASLLGQSSAAILCVALLLNSLGLLSSINPRAGSKGGRRAFVVIALLGGLYVISAVTQLWVGEIEKVKGRFYVFELPVMILAALVALYFSCWAIKGVLRRFNQEDEPLFTRAGALLFMLGYEVVLFGLMYTYLTNNAEMLGGMVNHSFWLISLVPVIAVPIWSISSYDKYLECSGALPGESPTGGHMLLYIFARSNVLLCVGLFAIWAAGSLAATFMTGLDLLPHLRTIGILFSFYLVLALLQELSVLGRPFSSKIGRLLGFVGIVYTLLPVLLTFILDSEVLYLHSPVGFIFGMFELRPGEVVVPNSVWITNIALSIVPMWLVWKRHLHILNTRRKM